jgi:hypothetical protein
MRRWLPGFVTLILGLSAGWPVMGQNQAEFAALDSTMERLVFDGIPDAPFSNDANVRAADDTLKTLDRVLQRLPVLIAPSLSLPSPQSAPAPQAAPTASATAMEGSYVLQNRYVYECVPKKGPFGHTHYRWEMVCRPFWVYQQAPKVGVYASGSEMTVLLEQIDKLSKAVGLLLGPNRNDDQDFQDLLRTARRRDLARQVYGVTLTANRASLAGVIPRNPPPPAQTNQ